MKRNLPPLARGTSRVHPRAHRQCRHPRDRARFRRQERRPRGAQAHAARTRPTAATSSGAGSGCIAPARLPPVVLADITGRDSDGELLARPTEWDEEAHGAPPVIRIATPRRARPGEVAGVGDRALLRIEQTGDGRNERTRHQADRPRQASHAWYFSRPAERRRPPGAGRQETTRPRTDDRARAHRRRRGRRSRRGRGVAPWPARPAGRVGRRTARLAQERARRQPDRHPCARYSAHVFSRAIIAEAEAARPATLEGREDWRDVPFVTIDPPDAKDHDDAVHATPDPDPRNAGGHIVSVAIADVAHYVRPGSALDRAALERGNSVYFPDRVVPMLPERISNDLCSLRPHEDRAGARRAHGDRRRWPQALAHVPSRDDPLGGAAALRASAACGLRPHRRNHRTACRQNPGAALRRLSRGAARAATNAARSISICPSARSCSSPTAPSIG